ITTRKTSVHVIAFARPSPRSAHRRRATKCLLQVVFMALPFKLAPEMSGVETQREAVFSESQRGCQSSWIAIRDRTPTEIAAPRRRVRPGPNRRGRKLRAPSRVDRNTRRRRLQNYARFLGRASGRAECSAWWLLFLP